MRHSHFEHQFVEYLPEQLEGGVLYISIPYATAAHYCACGCGKEVITPFSPTDWKVTFDGETVSLSPSIGNWNFPCRSHYFIRRSCVIEAPSWTDKRVEAGRYEDRLAKAHYYNATQLHTNVDPAPQASRSLKSVKDNFSLLKTCLRTIRAFWKKIRGKSNASEDSR